MTGLIFPVTVLYLYLRPVKGRWGSYKKYLAILVLGYLGYQIKPQTIFVVIAIALWELVCFRKRFEAKHLKRYLMFLLTVVLCVGGLKTGLNAIYNKEGFVFQKDKAFGMTHFFMMGLNPETMGVYSEEDVLASKECETVEERTRMNLEVSGQRLKAYGPVGYLRFLSKKMLTNYNDGTFAWSMEGNFYMKLRDPKSGIAQFLRNIYYVDGSYYKWFQLVVQGFWLAVLAGCFAAGCFRVKNDTYNKDYVIVLMLSIVGLTVFELLFEARARYLFTYVPVYIITACLGAVRIKSHCRNLQALSKRFG